MIASTISLGLHLAWTSVQGIQALGQVLGVYNYIMAPKVEINGKHLTKGDAFPPYNNKLRVYNMRFCPFGQCTLLALDAKQVDYEVVNIDIIDKPEWYAEKVFSGKVPALEVKEGEIIIESLITVEYIDEVYPQRPLLPKDPLRRAEDKVLVEVLGNGARALLMKLTRDHTNVTEDVIKAYHKSLEHVQNVLKKRGTTFLDGEQPGFADYMIWVWFERMFAFDEDFIKITDSKYPLLSAYVRKMAQDPTVKLTMVPKEIMQKYLLCYRTPRSKPDYDILHK